MKRYEVTRIVDGVTHELYKLLVQKKVIERKKLFQTFFISLVSVNNLIENAGDIIQILNVSMR